MEIFFGILAMLSIIICTLIIVDKTLFEKKINSIDVGMTGREIQENTGLRLRIIKVDGNTYYARVISVSTIFKYRFAFYDGKLVNKQRE